MMSDGQCQEKLIDKQAIKHLVILIGIALVIGAYLILTTVLISKDGVFYIERAQQFMSDPVEIIKRHPPGYLFMILTAHKAISLFTHEHSNQAWIYSAQIVTLLCKLLTMVPLYFMGKLLVGSKNSFWGLLILIFLPFPTKAACEILREWPYLLFLTSGFFSLLWAAKYSKWWAFGLVGLISGLGYLIRPESAQLIVFGLMWAGVSLFRPRLWSVSRGKSLVAIVLLLIAFAIPTVPYMAYSGKVLPSKVKMIINTFLNDNSEVSSVQSGTFVHYQGHNIAGAEIVSVRVLKALGEVFSTLGENLMWFFVPALMIGLLYCLRNSAQYENIIFITAFVLMAITMMVLRYCISIPHVSQRWSLPLVVFTVFYIPIGLLIMGEWLNSKLSHSKQKAAIAKDRRLSWPVVLCLVGVGICLPKLLKPVGADKQGYREAAFWLSDNTGVDDVIAAADSRLLFYSDRKGFSYNKGVSKKNDFKNDILSVQYIVDIVRVEDSDRVLGIDKLFQKKHSVWVDKQDKKKRIDIYKSL